MNFSAVRHVMTAQKRILDLDTSSITRPESVVNLLYTPESVSKYSDAFFRSGPTHGIDIDVSSNPRLKSNQAIVNVLSRSIFVVYSWPGIIFSSRPARKRETG